MNQQHRKRKRDIKSKLLAAVCMLLVASIMMVSSTYAWFTLSTAPEVTGITTAVGANGNLEIALMPKEGNASSITSKSGDSMAVKPKNEANITWGNLVDLSEGYGLDKISLYPAALNLEKKAEGDESPDKLSAAPLKFPQYGNDGRVSELSTNTLTGIYQDNKFAVSEAEMGVRAVGTSSQLTDREIAFRGILRDANSAAALASSAASRSLTANGSTLANIAIKHALATDNSDRYSDDDVAALMNAIDSLWTEDGKGALNYIENALKQYIIAHEIAKAENEEGFETLQTELADKSLDELMSTYSSVEMGTYVDALNAAKSNVEAARNGLQALSGGNYEWSAISDPLYKLVNTSEMEINGFKVAEVRDNAGALAQNYMSTGALVLTLKSGAGVYADIADFCGDYSSTINIEELKYGTLVVEDVPATMKTETDKNPTYLAAAAAGVGTFVAASGDAATNASITDYYGYIIDLAFRTNAVNSNLLLQKEGVNRVYADGTNAQTMGGGTSMSFKAFDSNFNANVSNLMKYIRVVFFDPSKDNEIIGYAQLDADSATFAADGTVTMNLVMTDAEGEAKVGDGANVIMALEQNKAQQLSLLVYLDGEEITNADVANAAQSMTGSLNLQFASSEKLVPMDYSPLKNGNSDEVINLTAVDATAVNDATVVKAVYSEGKVVVVFSADVEGTLQAQVAGGDTYTMTKGSVGGVTGYVFSPTESIEAGTVITITKTA